MNLNVISPVTPELTYTNVAASTETEWSVSTTYAQDDLVLVSTSTPHMVYKSLRGANTGHAPEDNLEPNNETTSSSTSMAVVTGVKNITIGTGKSFEAGMIVYITKTTTPSSVNMIGEVTAYDDVTGLLTVSVYSVTGDGTHSMWTVAGIDEIGFWEEYEATNQYKMLDGYANTTSVNADEIHIKMEFTEVDQIALFGISGKTVELEVWDITETEELWSTSIDLVYGSLSANQVLDWWEYFFGRLSLIKDLTTWVGGNAFTGVLVLKIIAETGTNAECGGVVVGRGISVGEAHYGLTGGIIDYSKKTTDDLGRTTLTKGSYAKEMSAVTHIENSNIDNVFKALSDLRSVTTAFYLDEDTEMTTVYGFIKEYSIVLSGVNYTLCNIEVEGMI